MKIISHRGNLLGPNTCKENSLESITQAIEKGFDVEIDIRFIDGHFYLGHDAPTYKITLSELESIKNKLWIHCKNFYALDEMYGSDFNYFFHHGDDHTLTSKGYIWTYPGKEQGKNNILVCPEYKMSIEEVLKLDSWGICSDYALLIRDHYSSKDFSASTENP